MNVVFGDGHGVDMKNQGMYELQRINTQVQSALGYFESNPNACSACSQLEAHLGTEQFSKIWDWMVDKAGDQVEKIDQAILKNIDAITASEDGIAEVFDKVKN